MGAAEGRVETPVKRPQTTRTLIRLSKEADTGLEGFREGGQWYHLKNVAMALLRGGSVLRS